MADYRQVSDVKILRLNDHSKNKSKFYSIGLVIELIDDDDEDDDDDCVFVKKEKNMIPRGNNIQDSIFVDGYCKQERGSVKTPKLENKIPIDVDSVQCVDDYDDDNDEVRIITVTPPSRLRFHRKRRIPFSSVSVTEVGESSGSKWMDNVEEAVEVNPVEMMFTCEICADTKPQNESFTIKGCSHSYCYDCMKSYVASKLHDGISVINCPVPSCHGVLEPEYCREILPFEVFDRWGKLLCESVILASQKFYCPFKDCSALLIDDGGEMVTQSECPSCFRLFCAQCKVGWHDSIGCAEYQKLSKDEREKEDIMLRNLAKNQRWQRCPTCKFYVEKAEGCLYMKCRCGIAFCYSCGDIHTDHAYHYCKKCGR